MTTSTCPRTTNNHPAMRSGSSLLFQDRLHLEVVLLRRYPEGRTNPHHRRSALHLRRWTLATMRDLWQHCPSVEVRGRGYDAINIAEPFRFRG
jgi:hypothetical protein